MYLFIGAKEFAGEALKMTSEFANQASEYLQEKIPVAIEGIDNYYIIWSSFFLSFSWKRICC